MAADSSQGEDEGDTQLSAYAPILRDGRIEQNVMREFGGLRRFQSDDTLDILPIIEVVSESDLDNLGVYAQTGTSVLVDVPEYLMETEEPNGYTSDIEDLLSSSSSPVEFLNDHSEQIPVPVVSGHLEPPFDYSEVTDRYENLSDDFDRVAVRVFIDESKLRRSQISDLENLADELSSDDIVLLDSIVPTELGPNSTARENLNESASIFDGHQRVILDAFSVFRGVNYNFGPAIAREAGVSGFGDFAHDRRLPPAEDIPMGQHDTRNIYHYDFEDRQQEKFQGENGYNGPNSAFESLSDWDKWDPDHCFFCEQAEASDSEGFGFWKEIRMGHYVESVVETES
jgi:SepF-like predicted cell division protein (DUF552 family)